MNEKVYETGFYAPEGMRVYAIGDIHGCLDLFHKLHEKISFDLIENPPTGDVHIVYMGDYVDKGPDSKGVVDALIERRDRGDGIKKTFLLGNHEYGMLDFISRPDQASRSDWLRWGGIETLRSYGIVFEEGIALPSEKEQAATRLRDIVPPAHIAFLRSLANAVEIGGFFFAHAGVDPLKSVHKQDFEDLCFIREPFLSWKKVLSHMIVHGHTRTRGEPEVQPHRINVDTGACETGILTAGVIEGNSVRFLQVSRAI